MLKNAIQERWEILKTSHDNDVLTYVILSSLPKIGQVTKVAAKAGANNVSPENENPVHESQGEVTAKVP